MNFQTYITDKAEGIVTLSMVDGVCHASIRHYNSDTGELQPLDESMYSHEELDEIIERTQNELAGLIQFRTDCHALD